jgi:hypothetical protein
VSQGRRDARSNRRQAAPATSNTTAPERQSAAARRATALQDAARAKHATALRRAEDGLRRLLKDGDEITFRSVARAGSVSLDFLYAQPDLRSRIEGLRAQQQTARRPSRADPSRDGESENNVLRTLASQLKAERTARLEQVRELEAKLAAAHGEILRLRRQHVVADDRGRDARVDEQGPPITEERTNGSS